MVYVMVVYAMTSFIHIESVWRQRSEGEDPIAFSFVSPLFAVPVNLLYPHHFQIFHGVVWLAEVGRNWLFRLPRPDVGAVSIHPGVQGFSVSPTYCTPQLLARHKIDIVLSGGTPTPAGTSVFSKHNWDMEIGYLWLNGWGIYHLMGWAFMT